LATRFRAQPDNRYAEAPVDIEDERRSEARSTLHRTWNVSIESEAFGFRLARVLDYSPSGIRLSLETLSKLEPGARLKIHHPGTNCSYTATVAWSQQQHRAILVGARLLETAAAVQQAC
jgi:hypothetical protein